MDSAVGAEQNKRVQPDGLSGVSDSDLAVVLRQAQCALLLQVRADRGRADRVVIPAEGSAPTPVPAGGLHLLVADTGVGEIYQYGVALALCGAELLRDELPGWECPEDCGCDHEALYCLDCVHEAATKSAGTRRISGTGASHEIGRSAADSGTGAAR